MSDQLVDRLLPLLLTSRSEPEFNVFDVMHHGKYENQISNIFKWLLRADETHGLGDRFLRIFIDHVNRSRGLRGPIPYDSYGVSPEIDTTGRRTDIADLVVEGPTHVMVVENYFTSSGHGHGFTNYQNYGARDGKDSTVVMLCGALNPPLLVDGWQDAAVVTHESLVVHLCRLVDSDEDYRRSHPSQCAFFDHMYAYFVKGRRMNQAELIPFIQAMCDTGQGGRYRQNPESGALNFAEDLKQQALERFLESRDTLQAIKASLKAYTAGVLAAQLNEVLPDLRITDISANLAGIYQWTVNVIVAGEAEGSEATWQIKFGPSAWFANEEHDYWERTQANPDYTHLFLTRLATREIRQSSVTLAAALQGISPDDVTLRNEIVSLLAEPL